MASIATSLGQYVEDSSANCPGGLREQGLETFHDVQEDVHYGNNTALTRPTDELLERRNRAERPCEVDPWVPRPKLRVDLIDPLAHSHSHELAARHATPPGLLAGPRSGIDDFCRAFNEDGERIEAALEPQVVDVFCRMVGVVSEYQDELEGGT